MGSSTDNLDSHEGDVGVLSASAEDHGAAAGNIAGAHRNFIVEVEVATVEVVGVKVLGHNVLVISHDVLDSPSDHLVTSVVADLVGNNVSLNSNSIIQLDTLTSVHLNSHQGVIGANVHQGVSSAAGDTNSLIQLSHQIVVGHSLQLAVVENIALQNLGNASKLNSILQVLPPETAADISGDGIHVTGGASKILGLDRLLFGKLSLPVIIHDDAEYATVLGGGKLLENPVLLGEILGKR